MESQGMLYKCDGDVNELAISMCEDGKKALLFLSKTSYTPTIQSICARRDSIFVTEDSLYFEAVVSNFDAFDIFIFADKRLNDFEREFFAQLQARGKKKIIEIVATK